MVHIFIWFTEYFLQWFAVIPPSLSLFNISYDYSFKSPSSTAGGDADMPPLTFL